MKLEGNIWFVTGGASGLGLATVHLFVKQGGYVAVLDLNEDAGKELETELGDKVVFCKVDVREEEEILEAIKVVQSKWPKQLIGGVVHCGGIGMAGKTIANDGSPFSLDVFRDTIDINLIGSFNIARLITSALVAQHPRPTSSSSIPEHTRGVIILVSSVSYEEGQMGQVAYAASKAGVVGMLLPMARDLARWGVRVVGVAPSLFETSMGKNTSPKVRANLLKSTLFPERFGDAKEFAQLCTQIVENEMLNGSVIRLDGGSRMAKF